VACGRSDPVHSWLNIRCIQTRVQRMRDRIDRFLDLDGAAWLLIVSHFVGGRSSIDTCTQIYSQAARDCAQPGIGLSMRRDARECYVRIIISSSPLLVGCQVLSAQDLVLAYCHQQEQVLNQCLFLPQTPEAEFFLEWYSQALIKHGDAVLGKAQEVFAGTGVILAAKVAGIHWQTDTKSHGPELTAGYYTTAKRDGYGPIAQMFAKRGAMFDFTCLEMRDEELPTWAKSLPSQLVAHTKKTAIKHGCMYAGENALPRFDRRGFEQMQDQVQVPYLNPKP